MYILHVYTLRINILYLNMCKVYWQGLPYSVLSFAVRLRSQESGSQSVFGEKMAKELKEDITGKINDPSNTSLT